jgi:large subunit ribosomal protein L35
MPKMKSHKGIRKRMKLTRRGKVTRRRANRGHLMSGKRSKRRRQLRRKAIVAKGQVKIYTRLLGG